MDIKKYIKMKDWVRVLCIPKNRTGSTEVQSCITDPSCTIGPEYLNLIANFPAVEPSATAIMKLIYSEMEGTSDCVKETIDIVGGSLFESSSRNGLRDQLISIALQFICIAKIYGDNNCTAIKRFYDFYNSRK